MSATTETAAGTDGTDGSDNTDGSGSTDRSGSGSGSGSTDGSGSTNSSGDTGDSGNSGSTAGTPRKDTVFGRISGALRERSFRWWFAGQITSTSGLMAQGVAVSWWMLQKTGDAVWLSALTICAWGPTLIINVWAGAIVDRSDRRRLLLATQAALLAVATVLTVLSATGELAVWNVLVATVLSGVATAIDAPARQVYVVDLVGADGVASAVGLWEVALNASRVVGPGLGGALLAGPGGVTACIGVNAASYLIPLIVLLRMKSHAGTKPARDRRPARGLAREGVRYALHSPVIRALLPMSTASGLIFGMGVALPPLVERALHQGGGGYGAMMAAFGAGGLPGAFLAAAQPEPTGRRVRTLALATAATVLVIAVAPSMPIALAGMAALGLTSIWFIASANTLAQLRCAPEMRGRVMSLWGVAMTGTAPFTGFAVASVIQYVGPREGFSISGIMLGAAALAGWRALRD